MATSLAQSKTPNKACSGRWGFCGTLCGKHFPSFEFFLPQAESTPAPAPVKHTTGWLRKEKLINEKKQDYS
jgi:hypothetical protein